MTVREALVVLREHAEGAAPPAGARRDRPRLPAPRPAGDHAVGRRGAAHQDRRAPASHAGERLLYILDEPTTGLHFDDIAKLLAAFRKLLEAGHTLVVIEHNLDVIKIGRLDHRSGPRRRRRRRPRARDGHARAGGARRRVAHRQVPPGSVIVWQAPPDSGPITDAAHDSVREPCARGCRRSVCRVERSGQSMLMDVMARHGVQLPGGSVERAFDEGMRASTPVDPRVLCHAVGGDDEHAPAATASTRPSHSGSSPAVRAAPPHRRSWRRQGRRWCR